MNITKALSLIFALIFALTACGKAPSGNVENNSDAVEIMLSDNGITVDGEAAGKIIQVRFILQTQIEFEGV